MNKKYVSSGTKWEGIVGYSMTLRSGSVVYVSGTTATNTEGNIDGIDDAYVQAEQAIMNIQSALSQLGSSLDNVVRTRICVKDIDDWQKVGVAMRKTLRMRGL